MRTRKVVMPNKNVEPKATTTRRRKGPDENGTKKAVPAAHGNGNGNGHRTAPAGNGHGEARAPSASEASASHEVVKAQASRLVSEPVKGAAGSRPAVSSGSRNTMINASGSTVPITEWDHLTADSRAEIEHLTEVLKAMKQG